MAISQKLHFSFFTIQRPLLCHIVRLQTRMNALLARAPPAERQTYSARALSTCCVGKNCRTVKSMPPVQNLVRISIVSGPDNTILITARCLYPSPRVAIGFLNQAIHLPDTVGHGHSQPLQPGTDFCYPRIKTPFFIFTRRLDPIMQQHPARSDYVSSDPSA